MVKIKASALLYYSLREREGGMNKAEAGFLHLLVLRVTSSNGNAQPYKVLLYLH
jgi:hypothetical protein